jgi:O-antigen/teichoic acid export membrane protein
MNAIRRSLRTYGAALFNSVVLRSAFWFAAGTMASRALAFVTVPVYAFLLTPEQLGTTALFLTFGRLFLITASLYLYVAPIRARADYDDAGYRGFIASVTALSMITTTLLGGIVLLLPETWLMALFQLPKTWIAVAVVSTPLTLPMYVMLSVLQGESKAMRYMRLALVQEVLIVIASIAFIILPLGFDASFDRAIGRIIGVLLVRTVTGVLFMRLLLGGAIFNRANWRYALFYAVPIMPHALANEMLANYDRVMIAQFYSERETGIYSVIYQFGSVIALLAAAAAAAWGPWFYRQMTDGKIALVRSRTSQYTLGFTGLTLLVIVSAPPVVRLILPPVYWEGLPLIPIIMSSGFFLFLHYFFTYVEAQERRTIYTSIATLSAAGLNIALNAVLFRQFQYGIAAWTTAASYAFLLLVHVGVVRLILKSDRVNDLRLMTVCSIAVCAAAAIVGWAWSGGGG